ncbi:Y-family DNA polymerase [Thalassolituus sp. LLYu03]|uniref:Y-family DNA polymerase n=1 Tax=Thalassolituus sp. LLYu03 TaxID=3421656 RepID=UPI003D2C0175
MRWLYLWFPDLYLHHLLQHSDDAQLPLALLPPGNGQAAHIVSCNQAARRQGVEADMPLTTALCLCPALSLARLDPHQQQQLLDGRALWAGQFSAQVCPDGDDGLWLESASMLRLFQGHEALIARITQAAAAEQWPLHCGSGDTPLAARLRACCRLPAGAGLQPLTLAQLHQGRLLNADELAQLQRLGIQRLSDLLRLPHSGLASRFGTGLSLRLQRLSGQQAHPLPAFQPAEYFQQQAQFIREVEHANGLLFPLQRLLQRLAEFLQRRQLSTRCLYLHLTHRGQPATDWSVRFAHGEYRQPELVYLCRYFLEKQTLRAPVQTLILQVREFSERNRQQKTLLTGPEQCAAFAQQHNHNDHQHSDSQQLLNRLGSRLLPHQLLQLRARPDPRPEQAARLVPCDSDSVRQPQPALRPDLGQRPLWLLAEPLPCPPPEHIVSGPERLCSGWWDDQPLRRDYYRARQGAQLVWLFHSDGQWFIHGVFS